MSDDRLKREKVFKETCWCYYCCIGGEGFGPVGDPLIGSEFKQLCLAGTCVTTPDLGVCGEDEKDGVCSQLGVTCCFTSHYQVPPLAGAPWVTCCNCPLMGASGEVQRKDPAFNIPDIFKETFWLYYCFCLGSGVSMPGKGGRPLIVARTKLLFVREKVDCVEVMQDGILCASVGTTLCVWSECSLPPAEGNPKIQCCGMPKKGNGGAPAQQEMK